MARAPTTSPPVLGLSSCLLGEPVRYDGGHRHRPALVEALAHEFQLRAFCPEREAGLGVPRPPVQLVRLAGGIHARGVADPALDVSAALQACSAANTAKIETLSGFVFKARSPSCGVSSTPVYDSQGALLETASGLFAAYVLAHFPQLPVAEDEQLLDPAAQADFIAQVWAHFRERGVERG